MLSNSQSLRVKPCERIMFNEPSEFGLDLILRAGDRETDVFVPFDSLDRGGVRHLELTISYLQEKLEALH